MQNLVGFTSIFNPRHRPENKPRRITLIKKNSLVFVLLPIKNQHVRLKNILKRNANLLK